MFQQSSREQENLLDSPNADVHDILIYSSIRLTLREIELQVIRYHLKKITYLYWSNDHSAHNFLWRNTFLCYISNTRHDYKTVESEAIKFNCKIPLGAHRLRSMEHKKLLLHSLQINLN